MDISDQQIRWLTGVVGLLAAVITGTGEFLLHFDPQARFTDGLAFFEGISETRSNWGHFIGVLGAPLYAVGAYHIYLMLRSANHRWAFILFIVMAYGCALGGVWMGSRASISAIVNAPQYADLGHLVALYDLRYESLLNVTRFGILAISIIYIWLTASGRSDYPKWMAFFNPIILLLFSFAVWLAVPDIGKFMMPIALNIGFAIFFALSLFHVHRLRTDTKEPTDA
ncbi:MAG: DUF6796 family protein [Erythrobacter sp.]|uniref:DUF6796 family protein n=1 Tax=Erythrobacter sp. TaxID=1042 RepID=UPI003262FB51